LSGSICAEHHVGPAAVKAGCGVLAKATIHHERKSNGVMPARSSPMTRQRWKLWKLATKPLKAAQSDVLMEEPSMKTNRRQFVKANLLGSVAVALPLSTFGADVPRSGSGSQNPRYAKLDEILKQPVLKRELFTTPVIIETLELLRYQGSFLCRVRSRDGAEGISVGHSELNTLHPIFLHKLQPFFIGKDARDLDLLLEKVFIYGFNFRYNGISIGTPLATIEFAILDLLGRIANKSIGQLIGDLHHPDVAV
jgi:hypothetical protein